jgi:hypothetical protein
MAHDVHIRNTIQFTEYKITHEGYEITQPAKQAELRPKE